MAKKRTPKVYTPKKKTFMRVITFVIALAMIAGFVILFPFEFVSAAEVTETSVEMLSSEIKVTPEGQGLFTLKNLILIAAGFGGGYIISGLALRLAEKRKNESH
ncbi:MAG: hypothetical protein LBL98_04975 [Ruminococcus sp.]|jgi:hypothetical protein|nr:hypothetical protein [Ruminococcus sp.]